MPENFLALGLKFPIKRGILQQIVRWRCSFHSDRHRKCDAKLGFFNLIAIKISPRHRNQRMANRLCNPAHSSCLRKDAAI
jgi:hypothetical protein